MCVEIVVFALLCFRKVLHADYLYTVFVRMYALLLGLWCLLSKSRKLAQLRMLTGWHLVISQVPEVVQWMLFCFHKYVNKKLLIQCDMLAGVVAVNMLLCWQVTCSAVKREVSRQKQVHIIPWIWHQDGGQGRITADSARDEVVTCCIAGGAGNVLCWRAVDSAGV